MKKVISIFVILLFASSFAFSQDEIIFNSGERVNAKVMEISKNQVKYKKFSNLDGPLVIVNKKDVKKIIYKMVRRMYSQVILLNLVLIKIYLHTIFLMLFTASLPFRMNISLKMVN
jgi:hypothetical protein